jgi:hypothetical protein
MIEATSSFLTLGDMTTPVTAVLDNGADEKSTDELRQNRQLLYRRLEHDLQRRLRTRMVWNLNASTTFLVPSDGDSEIFSEPISDVFVSRSGQWMAIVRGNQTTLIYKLMCQRWRLVEQHNSNIQEDVAIDEMGKLVPTASHRHILQKGVQPIRDLGESDDLQGIAYVQDGNEIVKVNGRGKERLPVATLRTGLECKAIRIFPSDDDLEGRFWALLHDQGTASLSSVLLAGDQIIVCHNLKLMSDLRQVAVDQQGIILVFNETSKELSPISAFDFSPIGNLPRFILPENPIRIVPNLKYNFIVLQFPSLGWRFLSYDADVQG